MLIEGKVGEQIQLASGVSQPVRLDNSSALVVTDAHAKYQEAARRGNIFYGAIAGQTTTVGTNTTYTGLVLSNPVGSPVDLVLLKVGVSFIVAFAAGSHIGLMTGYAAATDVTHTAAVTPRSQFINGSGGCNGKLDSSATLSATPVLNTLLGSGLTGAITTVPQITPGLFDLDGSIVLPPGGFVAIYTSTASGSNSGGLSMSWEEVIR